MASSESHPMTSCPEAAQKLETLFAQLPAEKLDGIWRDIETVARTLANGLRVRDGPEDNHTTLGKGTLPQTLTSLLKSALEGSPIPDDSQTSVVTEILRVAANLCMDHDENRGNFLEAGLPQTILSLLEGYADLIPSGPSEIPLPLSIPHVKVVRNAIGVLLNSSVGYAPVRTRLTSLEAIVTILKLSVAIYPPGSWMSVALQETTPEAVTESWAIRSGLSNWSWRAISELKDDSTQIFNAAILSLLIPALRAFTPPYPQPALDSPFAIYSALRTSLLQADFDSLEESCMFLESLSLDVEDFRLSLARGLHFPSEHDGVPCLSSMLSFVELGDYPPLWYEGDFPDVKSHEKALNICKGAMIKSIVEVSAEEKNEDVLWDEQDPEQPGGEFVCKMVEWIRQYVSERGAAETENGQGSGRDDMVICATLSLGNLARRENHSKILLSSPHSIALLLSSPYVLGPTSDTRVKHGVVSLLKHLAQSSSQCTANIKALTDSGVVKRLTSSRIWEESVDPLREVVQVGAIGVVKHLCNAHIENTFALVLPSSPGEQSGLDQILALGLASDSIRVKSEGTRVLVNVIKSLCAGDSAAASANVNGTTIVPDRQPLREEALRLVLTPPCVQALARLIGRSGKYPILINEGTVALTLLGMQREGAPLVGSAIKAPLSHEGAPAAPLPTDPAPSTSAASTSALPSPDRSPSTALDMLVSVLKNITAQLATGHAATSLDFPFEIGVNICAFFAQLAKNNQSDDMVFIKAATKPYLEELAGRVSAQGKASMISTAAKRALEACGE